MRLLSHLFLDKRFKTGYVYCASIIAHHENHSYNNKHGNNTKTMSSRLCDSDIMPEKRAVTCTRKVSEPEDDTLLIARVLAQEKHAFRVLIGRYHLLVYSHAYKLTGNMWDAEDLMQEVFIKLYRSLAHFRGDSKLGTWLYRVTSTTWFNTVQSKSYKMRRCERPAYENDATINRIRDRRGYGDPERELETKLVQEHIRKSLDCLSPREKSAFVLRYYNDLQISEIAKTLSIADGTVKSLLFRATAKLRKRLHFLHPVHTYRSTI